MLPYFNKNAYTGANAWPAVLEDLNWFIAHGKGKKIYLDENGWPSATSTEMQPNSPNAVADVPNEEAYYKLLDSKCEFFKGVAGGGVRWFSHIIPIKKNLDTVSTIPTVC